LTEGKTCAYREQSSSNLEHTFTWSAGASKGKASHQTCLSVGFTDKIGNIG
jgi:hypothetical protein